METIVTTNDPVRLSFLTALLRDAGLTPVLLDGFASVMDGSIGALPRRLAVPTEDAALARQILREAGEA